VGKREMQESVATTGYVCGDWRARGFCRLGNRPFSSGADDGRSIRQPYPSRHIRGDATGVDAADCWLEQRAWAHTRERLHGMIALAVPYTVSTTVAGEPSFLFGYRAALVTGRRISPATLSIVLAGSI
jgi:hypothetical protein